MRSQNYFQKWQIFYTQINFLQPKCLWTVLKIQSTSAFNVGVELKMVWMQDGRGSEEFGSSRTGWTWNRNWWQVWLHWRLLEANWRSSDFVYDTSAFTQSVPKLRVVLQSVHCALNSLSGFLSTEFWLLKPTFVKWFCCGSLSWTGEVCGKTKQKTVTKEA